MIYSCMGYWCHCPSYACDFYYSVIADDKASAIKARNEAVLKYKETKNEQTYSKEKDDTET